MKIPIGPGPDSFYHRYIGNLSRWDHITFQVVIIATRANFLFDVESVLGASIHVPFGWLLLIIIYHYS